MTRSTIAASLACVLASIGAPDAAAGGARASDLLALFPDGEEKRKLILDCMGCHSLNDRILYADGALPDSAGFEASVRKMLMFSGAHTPFPVMSPERDAAATARFLAEHLTEQTVAKAAARSAVDVRVTDGVSITEWDLPEPRDLPHDLRVLGDGRILVTGMQTNRMYVLDPDAGTWHEEPIPGPGGNPRALDVGPSGDWWVAGGMTRKMSRYRAADGAWDHYDIEMYPHSTMLDSRERVWFNGHFTFDPIRMGYVDGTTGRTVLIEVPPNEQFTIATPIPYGLRVGPDGTVWCTELGGNRLLAYDPDAGAFRSYYLPTSFSGPRRLDVASDGSVWVPEFANGKIARFDPDTETFAELEFPTGNSLPYCARIDHARGRVWVSQCANDAIACIDARSGKIVEYALTTPDAFIRHLDVDQESGDVYAAYSHSPGLHPKVVRLRVAS